MMDKIMMLIALELLKSCWIYLVLLIFLITFLKKTTKKMHFKLALVTTIGIAVAVNILL